MTSAGQHSDTPGPAESAVPGPGGGVREAENRIEQALAGLDTLSELPVSEHVARFDAVHAALTDALSRADDLLSTPEPHGS